MNIRTAIYDAFVVWFRSIFFYVSLTFLALVLLPVFAYNPESEQDAFYNIYGIYGMGGIVYFVSAAMAFISSIPACLAFFIFLIVFPKISKSHNKFIVMSTVLLFGLSITFLSTYLAAIWYSENNTNYWIDFATVWKNYIEFLFFPVVGFVSTTLGIFSFRNSLHYDITTHSKPSVANTEMLFI